MIWADLIEHLVGGGDSSSGGGTGVASFQKFAITLWSAQIPYIGTYVGYYLTGYEDLSDLTNPPDSGKKKKDPLTIGTVGDEVNEAGEDANGRLKGDWVDEYTPRAKNAPDDAPLRNPLLRDPSLLADNAAMRLQENVLDIGPPASQLVRQSHEPSQEPIAEVVIRGVRPERGRGVGVTPGSHIPYQRDVMVPPLPPPGLAAGVAQKSSEPRRPELDGSPRVERFGLPPSQIPAGHWAQEVVIEAPRPFQPSVSDPRALAAAEGRGRIERADLLAFAQGGYNGLISAAQSVGRTVLDQGVDHVVGPLLVPLLSPYAQQPIDRLDAYRLPIDPRYGGAGIMGEQLFENLAFEALPLAPQLGQFARRVFRRERLLAPAFWFVGAGGIGDGSRAAKALSAAKDAARAAEETKLPRVKQFVELAMDYSLEQEMAEEVLMDAGMQPDWRELSIQDKDDAILKNLRTLAEKGNANAAEAHRRFSEAIEALAGPRPERDWTRREIFWIPPGSETSSDRHRDNGEVLVV